MDTTDKSSDPVPPTRRAEGGRRRRTLAWLLLAAVAVFALGSCGGSDADDDAGSSEPSSIVIPGAADMLTVGELLDREDQGRAGQNVVVAAMLIDDGAGMRMCEALAESFPPQCGGRSIEVINPDVIDVELTEEQGVRWSEGQVSLLGWVEGEAFFVS